MKKIKKYLMSLLLILTDCISPYVPPTSLTIPRLVVDGLVTDQPGPYKIKLTYTSISSAFVGNTGQYPSNAHVSIRDGEGNQEELKGDQNGTFETSPNGIRGIVGKTYTLIIILKDGTRYESMPEMLKPVSPIDSVYTVFKPPPAGSGAVGKFNVYVKSKDNATPKDYYRWTWKHYAFRSLCWDSSPLARNPCCTQCWDIEQCESCITLLSDELINGNKFNQYLLDIPYDSKDPYYLQIEQFSISEGAYKFWKSLDTQVNNVGGVFDPPPFRVAGNVFNVSNPDEQVLGYFGASAVYKEIIYLKRDYVQMPPLPPYQEYIFIRDYCVPCHENYFRTTIKPEGWID